MSFEEIGVGDGGKSAVVGEGTGEFAGGFAIEVAGVVAGGFANAVEVAVELAVEVVGGFAVEGAGAGEDAGDVDIDVEVGSEVAVVGEVMGGGVALANALVDAVEVAFEVSGEGKGAGEGEAEGAGEDAGVEAGAVTDFASGGFAGSLQVDRNFLKGAAKPKPFLWRRRLPASHHISQTQPLHAFLGWIGLRSFTRARTIRNWSRLRRSRTIRRGQQVGSLQGRPEAGRTT
ncbi:hypothetical protein [Streptomyces lydicus]|uniref:hypothetical protein n=1 Tax=Streptomyces lydicus TaxID=47763 RepID=UPI0036E7F517